VTGLLGFELSFWDYITFLSIFVVVAAFLVVVVLIAGLPGRIAIARKHPEAEAVKLMGWAGLLPVLPWIQAFIWAFKPTDVVDIRRFPKQEQEAITEEIARLSGADLPQNPENGPGTKPPKSGENQA